MVRGRPFNTSDHANAPSVAIISQSMADFYFGEEDPIGKRIRQDAGVPELDVWMTVVGMVANVREDRYNFRVDRPVWYIPYAQTDGGYNGVSLVMRTRGDPAQVAAQARQELATVFPERGAHWAERVKVDPTQCYALSAGSAEVAAHWDGARFRLLRVDDLNKIADKK